jgi:iron complex transport system substrate-binding protein
MTIRRGLVSASALLLVASLAACSGATANIPGAGGESGTNQVADTGECGPVTAEVAEQPLDPVADKPTSTLPVTVEGADGREVTVTDTSRILAVNLYGSLAEIVYNLGLGDNVIARDTSTDVAEAQDLPLVTRSGHDLAAEAVLELEPSVVIADASIGPPEVLNQLRRSGIPVVMIDDEQTLENVPLHIRQVAAALGVKPAGEKLVERVEQQITDAKATVPEDAEPLTIAFLYLRGTVGVQLVGGKGAGSDAMIEAIGAKDAGTELGLDGFRPLTTEALVKSAPDVLLVMTKGLESVGGIDGLLERPGVSQTPAGQNRRIVDIDDTALLSFGSDTGSAIEALAEAVYGGACASPAS